MASKKDLKKLEEQIKKAQQKAKAKSQKEKKGKSKSSSLSNLPKIAPEPTERTPFSERFKEDTKEIGIKKPSIPKANREKEVDNRRINPLIKTPTRMQGDTSPEIDNFAESLVRKGAQGFEGALVGHSDRRNMKEAESYLSGDYKKRFQPGVKTGLRMRVDDPTLVGRAEEQARKEGFKNLEDWEINKADEAIRRNDDYYERKAELDAAIEEQDYNKLVKWMPDAAEVIGSMIPTMAVGAATGGVGGMAGLTGRAMAALQHVFTGGEIAGRVSGQEARMIYDAVLDQKGARELNIDDYRDAIMKANTTGELVGIAEAATEMLFGGIAFMGKGILDHTIGKIGFEMLSPATKASIMAWRNTTSGRISTMVAQRLGGAMGEGMEEAIMSIAQPAIERNVAGVDSEFSIDEMIRDFGMGAAVSMILGMPVTMADTAVVAEGEIGRSRMQKELQELVYRKARELAESGEITVEDAANINAQVEDLRRGKGSLAQFEAVEEVKVTEDNLDAVYANHDEAREAMIAEAKTKKDGEKITARYIDKDGNVQLWQTHAKGGRITDVVGGITTESEKAKYTAKAQKVASAANATERTGYQLNVREDIIKEVSAISKAINREVEFIYDNNSAVHGYVKGDKIYVNANSSQSPARAVIAHEMTHMMENTMSYSTLRDMVYRFYGNSVADKRAEIISNYSAAGVKLSEKKNAQGYDEVDTELMAFFVEEKLLTDAESIKQVVKQDRTLAEKIVEFINKVIQKITGSREQKFLIEARDVWNKALQEEKSGAKQNNVETEDIAKKVKKRSPKVEAQDRRYSIADTFVPELEKWDEKGRPSNKRLFVGTVSDALKSIGIGENMDTDPKIYWYTTKLKKILEDHSEIELDTIKTLPNVLENPVIILENPKKVNRIVMFGEVYGTNEIPVMVVLELSRKEKNDLLIDEMFVVSSYARGSDKREGDETELKNHGIKKTQQIIDTYNLLYTDPNKKRTDDWMAVNRLQLPLGFTQYGSVGRISYIEKDVKGKIVVEDEAPTKTAMQIEMERAMSAKNTRNSIGAFKDSEYMDAVNRGDMTTAQRMVDEAAKAAGYSNRMYHGAKGGGGFTVFRGWQYFTENKDYAERYANRNAPESLYSVYVKMEKPFDTRDDEAREIFYDMFNEYGLTELQEDGLPDWTDGYDITDYIEENDLDYDSVLLNEGGDPINGTRSDGLGGGEFVSRGTSYVIRDSAQIKSADPVTYDDEGNVIPLSERFNVEKDDIRWSVGRPTDTKAERRDVKETDRLYDAQLEDMIKNAPELTQEEIWSINESIKITESQMKEELSRLADNYKKGKGRQKKNGRRGAGRELTSSLRVIGNRGGRKTHADKKRDNERRRLRIEIAKKWHNQNESKPKSGSVESLYLKDRPARQLTDEFRRGIITYLAESGAFIPTGSGGVMVDENSAEVAIRDTMTGEWDISYMKNQYVPSMELTYLAEAEGLNIDEFFTMYSKIIFMKEHKKPDGGYQYKRKDIVDYISSLNLTSKQKWFLYFDVARYARSAAPAFVSGGTVTEEKGNQRGRMLKALDNIAVDMYSGAMKDPNVYDGSHRINHEDVLAFADTVFGKEDSQAKEDFMVFFTGRIIVYSDEMMKIRAVERTNLLTDNPKEVNPYKTRILRLYRNLKKEIFAEGEAFERMADKLKNPLIRARYYDAKKSLGIANEMINAKHQRNINGEVVGKGLHEIFKPVFKADEKAKNNKMMTELTLLVNCRHDIDRMKYDKGYTGYTEDECKSNIERISREYPELVKVADDIAQYSKNLLQMCVDCGRISEEDQRYFNEKYPYYVPTFRLLNDQYYDREGNVVSRTNSVIKTAVGGHEDVLPLFDQLVRRTNEIVKACKKNQLATEIAKAYRDSKSAEFIVDIQETVLSEDMEDSIDKLGAVEELGRNRKKENGTDNIIPWYCSGVQHDIIIADENMLYGWDRINYMRKEPEVGKVMRKINAFRRAVLTQYNPTFFLTNHIKDVNDMFLYNQHAQRLPKYYALAWKVMVGGKTKDGKNRDYLEEYLAHGVSQASIFEYDLSNAGKRTKKMKAKSAMMAIPNGFNEINFVVEQVPRLAVYMETVDRLEKQRRDGGNTYTNEEIKTIAGYQASDATLNFGRSGTYVKAANTYGCTFLNAGVQGMDRFRRMFTQIKDGDKQAVAINLIGLMVKSTMLGLGSNWILDWIFGGDDEFAKWVREFLYEEDAERIRQEYLEMADYQRLNYFLFAWPFGEQEIWIRIPRGRVAAYMYSWAYNGEKVYRGEMDWIDLLQTQWDMAKDTVLPPNPIYENIIGPFLDVARNKDAWGEEIISSYEDLGEGYSYLEYDEDTTDMAIMLAEFAHKLTSNDETGMARFDVSPKHIDYIVEQYLGSYANLIMPMMNKDFDMKAGVPTGFNTLLKKFYIDPTISNRLAGDYYDLSDLHQNVAEAYEDDTPYAISSKIFITVNTQLKPLREASKAVSKATSMTRGEAFGYLDDVEAQAAMNGTNIDMLTEFRNELENNVKDRGELSRKEIQQLNRVIRDQMNQLYRTGTADARSLYDYASANYYGIEGNDSLYKEWYQNNKSAEWQITKITATSDSAKEKWEDYSSVGGDAQSFIDFYNYYSMTNSTYGKDGKSVKGQEKKDKCMKFLHNLNVSAALKEQLYLSVGNWSEKTMPRFSDGSNESMGINLDLIHPLGEAGEVDLSFMLENNGHIRIKVDAGSPVGSAMVGSVEKITRSEKYGDSISIKSTDANGNTVVIQYFGLEEIGSKHEGGAKIYDYIEAGDIIGKVGSEGLKFKVTVNGKPVDPADYVDLGTPSTINTEGYNTTGIGEEERDDDEKVASSGGYGGYRGGSRGGGGGGGRSVSLASVAGNISSNNASRNSGAAQAGSESSAVTGRSTNAAGYGTGGIMLPRANGINPVSLSYGGGSSLPTTPTTPRSGNAPSTGRSSYTPRTPETGTTRGYLWDDSILS